MGNEHDPQLVRNIGIISHFFFNDTATTERILFYTGLVHRVGEVHDGNTVTDWMLQERERGITITAAAITCEWKRCRVSIVDTPGHVDFTVEVERSLRVLDGAVAIFDSVGGVEPQSETVWRQANRYNVPRIAYVNKMDRVGADFPNVVSMLERKLSANVVPLHMPLGSEEHFEGIVDLVTMKAYRYPFGGDDGPAVEESDIPDALRERALRSREEMLEKICDFDEELLELLLEGAEPEPDTIRRAIRAGVVSGRITPVLCGSSFKNKGVQHLLDAIVDYLPSPVDRGAVKGKDPRSGKEIERKLCSREHFSALVFKVASDAHVGRIGFARVYSGSVPSRVVLINPRTGGKERISRAFRMHANKRNQLDFMESGDIVALVGLRETKTGDTICDQKNQIVYEEMQFPRPVIFRSIEPKSAGEEKKLENALERLADEDPTVAVEVDKETGQKIIGGMGELHLEILVDRMIREFGVEAHVGKPQVAYRESVSKKTVVDYEFCQMVGGRNLYASCSLSIAPSLDQEEIVFCSNICDSALPSSFIDSFRQGILESATGGVLSGYPVQGVRVELFSLGVREDESNDLAFRIAGAQVFQKLCAGAEPVILEPVMRLEVIVPADYMGVAISDLNARRGRVNGIDSRRDVQVVNAEVPLSEMFGYATALRSLSQGRAAYSMQFDRYERAGEQVQIDVLRRIGRR